MSDSHGKDIGWDLNNEVKCDGYEATVLTRPGCSFNTVIHDIEDFTKDFTKHDTVIILAGTNDISDKAEQPVEFNFDSIKETAKRTKVAVSTIPFSSGAISENTSGRKHLPENNSAKGEGTSRREPGTGKTKWEHVTGFTVHEASRMRETFAQPPGRSLPETEQNGGRRWVEIGGLQLE
ncbi:hypothetical protein LSTR_LSTR009338 [Laodelphax striatellus]|uniref:Uncharacterized protein n=1 Tax=Laodelphax striatellus TaxID=195883 RepID=A0A482XII2_LAOST|nr:hypothetical protein LSTR_LSTR009338 [Laodelphax striatellus]